ncbi:MAG: hypothetical protein ABEJ35_07415 [Halobacteriaceae archaeon]
MRLHYYDILLAAIGVAILVGVAIGVLTEIPIELAVIGAALIGILLTAHGLFVRGPVDSPADLAEEVEIDSELLK